MKQSVEQDILLHIDAARFAEALAEIGKLQQAAINRRIGVSDALEILRNARFGALAQRSHLVKSLAILEAGRLFQSSNSATVASWVMEA